MKDENKTKWQLLSELVKLRQRVAELEALDTWRKRAEEEIRRAKEEWERTFDAIPDLVAILDAEQRIVRSNQAMADSLGLAPEEIVGTRCYECFHSAPESPPFCPYIQMAKNKRTHSEEVYVERLGKDFMVTTSPLFDAQGQVSGCVHVARDITERKRAEAALRESEERYRTLFETMVQGVVYQDAEGRITSANPAAERILGLTLDQMQGRTSLDPRWKAVHKDGSDFPGEAHPAMLALKTGTQVRNVVMGVFDPRRAEYRWIKVDAVPQFNPAEDKPYQVYTTFDDITERKQAEETKAWLASFPERNPNPIVEIDLAGHVQYLNPAARQLFPDLEPKATDEQTAGIRHPWLADWESVADGFRKGETGSILREAMIGECCYEQALHYVEGGQRIRIYGFDVTERKQAEKVLQASETRYRRLFESARDGILILDADTGQITDANPFLIEMLGYSRSEFLGKTLWEIGPFRDIATSKAAFMELQSKGYIRYEDLPLETSDGRHIDVEFVSNVYSVDHKQVIQCNIRDITGRKRAEDALDERMRFETVLSDLSATLVKLPVSEVGQAIQRGLERIVEFLDVDQGTLSEFSEGQTRLYSVHSYSRPGILPASAMVASDEFPWHMGQLRQGEMVLTERIDDLSAEAARDKDSALKMGIKSHLAIPLTVGGATLGVISFGSFRRERAWPRDVIPRLRLIGEIFANTLARKRAEEALARHDREMAALYETSLDINSQPDVSTLLHAIVRLAAQLLGTRMGGLYLAKPDGETLELVVSYNLPSDYTGVTLRPGEGVAGRVTQTGKPMMVDDYLAWEGRVAVYADGSFRRVLGVPLTVGSRIIGVITVQDELVRLFEEDQVRLLSLFADQAAIAVENARLVEALRRQNEYRTALQETTLDLISRLNLGNLLENIVKRAGQLMETLNGFLDLVEPETNQLKPQVGLGALAESLQFQVTPGEGVAGTVWQTGEPLVIDDYDAWPGRIVDYSHRTIRSVIGVPLLSGSQVVGVLGLAHDYTTSQAFGQEAVELLSQFARLAAIAIENAQLYETAQRELAERKRAEEALQRLNHDLSRLIRVGQALSATLDPQEVTARLMLALTQAIGAEGSSVWLWDEEQPGGLICRGAAYPGLQRSLIGWRLGPGEGVATWVAQHGQSVVVPSVSDDPRFSPRIDSHIGFRTASLLVVPLRVRDQVIGALEAVNKHDGEFDTHDRFLLETLAPSAAIAIENARLVEALRQSNAELEARNEELDAFAHTVAHDLKNPVGPIVGFAEILMRDYAVMPEDERQRCIQAIARSGRKIKSIIEELLLLAEVRQVQVATEPLDMSGIVSEALQRLIDAVGQSHAETVWPDASAWPAALGYAPWVEEVWVNYLSNALKYGGRPPRIELGAEVQPDGMARFWVRDNGPGIPPEAQSRLFTPFTRLDQVHVKGHGLGLSIARRIVEKLGGQVGVESQTGQGSAFYFTLPGAPI